MEKFKPFERKARGKKGGFGDRKNIYGIADRSSKQESDEFKI